MARKYIQNCTGPECRREDSAHSRLISRIIFYVLLSAFVGVSIYVVLFSPYLQITNISISGTQELDPAEIQNVITQFQGEKFFKIIPKNNFLFMSQSRIGDALKNDFKKIRNVRVIKTFPDTISIAIEERKALIVWCAGDQCYLIDENGVAYNTADFNSPELAQNNLLKIDDESSAPVEIGSEILDQAYVQYALSIKDALKAEGFEPDGDYSTPSRMASEIKVHTANGNQIFFSTQFSLDSAITALTLVLKKEIPQDQQSNLDYVDLRTENKVFYKMKNSDGQSVQQTDSALQATDQQTTDRKDDSSKKSSDDKNKKKK